MWNNINAIFKAKLPNWGVNCINIFIINKLKRFLRWKS